MLWSPDGDELIYRSNRRSTGNQLYRVSAAEVGRTEMLLSVAQQRDLQQSNPVPTDWSQSGAYLVYHAATPKGYDLWALSLSDRKVVSLKQTPSNELHGSISTDSRWLAYASISPAGMRCMCRRSLTRKTFGRFQPRADHSLVGARMVANCCICSAMGLSCLCRSTAPTFAREGIPVPLFKTGLSGVDEYRWQYVPSRDGKRILMSTALDDGDRPAITVVLNWPALLKK